MSVTSAARLSGLIFMLAIVPSQNAASAERVLYDFPHGSAPIGRVVEDVSGNFYATTQGPKSGAAYLLKQRHGAWKPTTLHQFTGADGANPIAGLISDPNTGALFGTTLRGGAHDSGTIYSLTQGASGWTETVLHDFDGSDGSNPIAELRRNSTTNILYGTASTGGSANCGTVFQFDPANSQFKVLYQFAGGADGCIPTVQLREGSKDGTLVGATQSGGDNNDGTVFLLTEKGGTWQESVTYTFHGSEGASPFDLDVSDDGTVYGVAASGGPSNVGVVFRLIPGHVWKYKTLFNFDDEHGNRPTGINLQENGTLIYGTTEFGGRGYGVVFKLQQNGSVWKQKVLHKFAQGADGGYPTGRPAIDPTTGVLYGVTSAGGSHLGGIFYSVTP